MSKLTNKLLNYTISKLNGIKQNIEKKQEIEKEKIWLSNFNSENFFDYQLNKKLRIRLYKDSVLSKLIFDGFEQDELEFTTRFLKEGDTFFDIGANIGLFSLVASEKVGNQGRVLSFEPSPRTFKRLVENINLNNINNIIPLNIGLSQDKGKLKLNVSENGYEAWNSFANLIDGKLQSSIEVEVDTLDEIIKVHKVKEIDLIKLDVEGWEKFVIYGGENFLRNHSPVIMIEFTESNTFAAGYHVQELYDILESWEYKWYRYVNGELQPEIKQLYYPYDNLIATKDLKYVVNRLKR